MNVGTTGTWKVSLKGKTKPEIHKNVNRRWEFGQHIFYRGADVVAKYEEAEVTEVTMVVPGDRAV